MLFRGKRGVREREDGCLCDRNDLGVCLTRSMWSRTFSQHQAKHLTSKPAEEAWLKSPNGPVVADDDSTLCSIHLVSVASFVFLSSSQQSATVKCQKEVYSASVNNSELDEQRRWLNMVREGSGHRVHSRTGFLNADFFFLNTHLFNNWLFLHVKHFLFSFIFPHAP